MAKSNPHRLEPLNPKKLRLEIVVPVYNEEGDLRSSIRKLEKYVSSLPYSVTITIADNGSTDGTWAMARKVEKSSKLVSAVHIDSKGRGLALSSSWSASSADILAYMDVDLSTDLRSLPDLLAPLISGNAAISVGSRLSPHSKVTRGTKRELISRAYNWLVHRWLKLEVKDSQCGFKAIRKEAAQALLPEIKDNVWFFDTELLFQAQQQGWIVEEIPVTWIDNPDSRVHIFKTAWADLKGIDRLRRNIGASPIWETPLLVLLLLGTAFLYLFSISKEDYGNDFYAAAVQAGTMSWKAFFFGSFDAANFITVDKPPFSLWVMELSGRIFGFSKLSMFVPDALSGVLSVYLLQRTIRRWYGAAGGLLAGLVLALTPVAVVMFRYNNPDAVLTLLLVASAYCFVRAMESAKTKWLVWVGVLLGTAFISKMLQALIILPIYALVYVWFAKPAFWRRVQQALWAGLALVLAGGWWPTVVSLVPAAARPYVGGSTNNSEWNLIFGYNGFGRLSGNEGRDRGGLDAVREMAQQAERAAGGMFGSMFGGQTGPLRMFENQFGGQISWLLPLALFLIVFGIWSRRHQPRTDLNRAGFMLWGGWLLLHAAVFSFAQGIIHEYYSIVMAPAVGALVGMGLPLLWSKTTKWLSWLWPVAVGGSVAWAWIILDRTPTFVPWLHWTLALLALLVVASWILGLRLSSIRLRLSAIGLGLLVLLAAPLAYDIKTVEAVQSGGQPTAGPAIAGARGFGRAGIPELLASAAPTPAGQTGDAGRFARGLRGEGGFARGGDRYPKQAPEGTEMTGEFVPPETTPNNTSDSTAFGLGFAGFGGTPFSTDSKLITFLKDHMGSATWAVATSSTSTAAPIELALGKPVMGMGGFMGSDPTPSLEQFEQYVAQGKLKYVLIGAVRGALGQMESTQDSTLPTFPGFAAANSEQNKIQVWVKAHGSIVNYGGTGETLYQVGQAR